MKEKFGEKSLEPLERQWHITRDVHAEAFEALYCFVGDIMEKEGVVSVTELNNQYRTLLSEIGGEEYYGNEFTSQK